MLRYLTVAAALLTMSAYQASILKWREQKEAELKADAGWLTVSGLFWLKEGSNRVDRAPGAFELRNGKTVFRPDTGAVTEFAPDASITSGDLTFILIKRGGRLGIRLKDKNSKLRADFKGQRWFPAREAYRVQARFVSYERPRGHAGRQCPWATRSRSRARVTRSFG